VALEKVLFPMVGLLITVDVKVGEKVDEGQPLAVFESMKMKMKLPAPCTGEIKEILVSAGQMVEAEQVFGTIES
jgi:propionyl-CoA carboxylase alpha chain